MSTVGVRELKNNLSRYLRCAENGETIVVTAHGRQVAQLGPARPSVPVVTGHPKLDELIAAGLARAPLEKGDPTAGWDMSLRFPPGTAAALIDRDRDES